uniref:Transposase n=1 Tax=Klebsiella pneumoniae TaxID=573 RepID=A0A8B0SSE8_KLEPN|nr:transposase [Klebsiella pneumoniae]
MNTMLDDALDTLNEHDKPVIHSDRGGHYRWPGWLERINTSGLIRSMSRKGCSSDNAACEGFFGRIKKTKCSMAETGRVSRWKKIYLLPRTGTYAGITRNVSSYH